MFKNIIENINENIDALQVFDTIHGLTHLVEENQVDTETGEVLDSTMIYPACYISNGQFDHVAFDNKVNVCYIRRNGDISIDENLEYELGCEDSLILTQSFRLVGLLFNVDIDDEYRDEKQASNIIHAIHESDNRKICSEMSIDSIKVKPTRISTDRYAMTRAEFQNIDIAIPYESIIFAIDMDVIIETSKDCWCNFYKKC